MESSDSLTHYDIQFFHVQIMFSFSFPIFALCISLEIEHHFKTLLHILFLFYMNADVRIACFAFQ